MLTNHGGWLAVFGSNRFKGAYCSIMEKEPCIDIFGEMDVMTDNFPDLARKIIEQSKKNAQ